MKIVQPADEFTVVPHAKYPLDPRVRGDDALFWRRGYAYINRPNRYFDA